MTWVPYLGIKWDYTLRPNLSFSIRDKHLLHKSALEEEICEIDIQNNHEHVEKLAKDKLKLKTDYC